MQKLCIFVAMMAFSYLGWFLGSQIGDFMAAFLVSAVFSLAGVWAGWWTHRRFFI